MPDSSHQIDAPLSLGSFFPPESDEEEEETPELDPCYEIQTVTLVAINLKVRQYAYHSHNANRVWPGTFNLADYLLAKNSEGSHSHHWGSVLELGTATGLLAIRLALASSNSCKNYACDDVVTSDVDDEEVEEHVRYNFELNGFDSDRVPTHIPHTWGNGWQQSAAKKGLESKVFDTIIASDILLYVSAYPALVQTLCELVQTLSTKFVMSWNRRMKESSEFFDRMTKAGFECKHEGKCVYTFRRLQIEEAARATLS